MLPGGSPSRDRLARIAAMIHDVEHPVGARSEPAVGDADLLPLVPRTRWAPANGNRAGRVAATGPAA